jgi:predicted metal-dependent peptidase
MAEIEITDKQRRRLSEARLRMLMKLPYFGNFIMGVPMIPDKKVKTAGADGRSIRYNPEWMFGDDMGRDELVGVLSHETLHLSFKHPLRRNHRDPELWNKACDYVVNPILQEAGITLRPKALLDPNMAGKTAEEVYDLLERRQQKQQKQQQKQQQGSGGGKGQPGGQPPPGQGGGNDPGDMGGVTDPQKQDGSGPASQDEVAMMEADIDGKVAAATQAAKAQGKMPAGLERLVLEALKPKIDWKDRLRKFVAKTIPSDFTWMRPSRRSMANGIYMPSTVKNGCGKLLVVIDTSGSIGDEELKQYWGEVCAIFEDCNPEELHVMYCDAAVAGHDVFRFGETPVLKPRGGGGTDFRPPFIKADKDNLRPQCAVYLTDGYGSFPEKEPPYPVLWVITTEVKSPHGETLPLQL